MKQSEEAMGWQDERYAAMTGAPATAIAIPAQGPVAQWDPAMPDYLVRHYAWAYLWPSAVWFFDHQPIINAILFGNYKKIMNATLSLLEPDTAGRTLQIAGVYGELTPTLAQSIDDLHLIDVAPVQLSAAQRKLSEIGKSAHLAAARASELLAALEQIATDAMFTREAIGTMARNYLRELGEHIRKEETALFPLAERRLSVTDWQAVAAQSRAYEDPLFGPRVAPGYRALFRRLAEAPAAGEPAGRAGH